MARWGDVVAEAPEFAAAVRERFDAGRHKTLATLRRDGSPRISGIETAFVGADLLFGGTVDSWKVIDLRRDPRFALHGPTLDASAWSGDAKVSGRAVEVVDPTELAALAAAQGEPPGPACIFRADLGEIVLTRLGDPPDHLVIESWHAGSGLRRTERR